MSQVAVNWFEIPVKDMDRAATFYSAVLDSTLGDMDGPAGPVKTFQSGEMPVGALVTGEHNEPSQSGTLVYLGTADIDAALERVSSSGGQVVLEKTSIGPFGHIGQFIDSEGNRVALHSN